MSFMCSNFRRAALKVDRVVRQEVSLGALGMQCIGVHAWHIQRLWRKQEGP